MSTYEISTVACDSESVTVRASWDVPGHALTLDRTYRWTADNGYVSDADETEDPWPPEEVSFALDTQASELRRPGPAVHAAPGPDAMTDLATQLRAARLARGWTQADLAAAAGLATITVQSLEQDQRAGRISTWTRVLAALGCELRIADSG